MAAPTECCQSCPGGLVPVRKGQRWPPIESNPDVMTQLAHKLGLPEGKYSFTDVWGLDAELLGMLPSPVVTIILLYPSPQGRKFNEAEAAKPESMEKAFFLHQIDELDDACGTIAIVHSLTNNQELLEIPADSLIAQYAAEFKAAQPTPRGESLAAHKQIAALHSSFAEQGQTEVPPDGIFFFFKKKILIFIFFCFSKY